MEGCGIAGGRAIAEALGDRAGIRRYGYSIVPMDESLAYAAVDLVRTPRAVIRLGVSGGAVEDTTASEIRHFLESLITSIEATAHVKILSGADDHHKVEACVKALALALRMALEIDPRLYGTPSAKGVM